MWTAQSPPFFLAVPFGHLTCFQPSAVHVPLTTATQPHPLPIYKDLLMSGQGHGICSCWPPVLKAFLPKSV